MHKLLIFSIFILSLLGLNTETQAQERYFPYPTPPENLVRLDERCNYLICHFWDHCNFKNAFSSLPKMKSAFGDFISFMPYATADTAFMAVDELLGKVKKSHKNTLAIVKMAESYLYCDTAQYYSEQLFLPFAKAAANHKKIPNEEKRYYSRISKILESSQVGMRAPDIKFTQADGSISSLSQHATPMVILLFTTPDCEGCNLAKLRLSADYALNRMIEDGRLNIINIYPSEATPEVIDAMGSTPSNWISGAAPDASEYFELEDNIPYIVYLARNMTIRGKGFSVDDIINSFQGHMLKQ